WPPCQLDAATTFERVRNFEPHALQNRIDLFDVFFSRLLVGASFETPVAITFGAFRTTSTEHIERSHVPIIDRLLHPLPLLVAFRQQLQRFVIAIFDMA